MVVEQPFLVLYEACFYLIDSLCVVGAGKAAASSSVYAVKGPVDSGQFFPVSLGLSFPMCLTHGLDIPVI